MFNENTDFEEASFHYWLSDSKQWFQKYGINKIIDELVSYNFEADEDFGRIDNE